MLYVMFVLIAAGGLSMTASSSRWPSISSSTKDRSICSGSRWRRESTPCRSVAFSTASGRPFFGWLSDQIGREYTMALAFLIGAAALFTLSQIGGTNPATFVLVTAL